MLVNRVTPADSGAAVEFITLFTNDDDAADLEEALLDVNKVKQIFAGVPALKNPRLVPQQPQQPLQPGGAPPPGE